MFRGMVYVLGCKMKFNTFMVIMLLVMSMSCFIGSFYLIDNDVDGWVCLLFASYVFFPSSKDR